MTACQVCQWAVVHWYAGPHRVDDLVQHQCHHYMRLDADFSAAIQLRQHLRNRPGSYLSEPRKDIGEIHVLSAHAGTEAMVFIIAVQR